MSEHATPRPNVLLVMADQLPSNCMSLISEGTIKAPRLAKLIAESAAFEDAYCAYPLCSPSRASLMTGRLPSAIGAYDNGAELAASVPTIAHHLRAAGYYTALVGKMHFLGPDQLHGFEDRLTTELYPADFSWTPRWDSDSPRYAYETGAGNSDVGTVMDSGAAAWTMQMEYDEEVCQAGRQTIMNLAREANDRPWFVTASFTSPHDPFVISDEYLSLYEDTQIPLPHVAAIPEDELDPHSREVQRINGMDKYQFGPEDILRARRAYYAMISYVDEKIGVLLDSLSESGQADNTVLVFTSDHGEMLGERGMWFKKTFFEPAVKVPLLVSWPHRIPARAVRGPVSLVDVLPTIADLTGTALGGLRDTLDGTSLAPHILRNDDAFETVAFCEGHDNATVAPRFMVRKGRYKYVYSAAYPPMLHDVEEDPHERRDRAGDPGLAEVQQRLHGLLEQRFDLEGLRDRIVRSQNDRRLVTQALSAGRRQHWEQGSTLDPTTRYVRSGDAFPDVERRGYVGHRQG